MYDDLTSFEHKPNQNFLQKLQKFSKTQRPRSNA